MAGSGYEGDGDTIGYTNILVTEHVIALDSWKRRCQNDHLMFVYVKPLLVLQVLRIH